MIDPMTPLLIVLLVLLLVLLGMWGHLAYRIRTVDQRVKIARHGPRGPVT